MIRECTCMLEKTTTMIGINRRTLSSYENVLNQVKDHSNNLIESSHSHMFYAYISEQIIIYGKKSSERRHPNESYTMAMSHTLHMHDSTRNENIRKTFLL